MNTDSELLQSLDPYGTLEFVIGSGDDFVCFDFALDTNRQRVALGSVLNSETGSFIQNFEDPWVGPCEQAVQVAREWTMLALDWVAENEVRLDMKGWNQDPAYFLRTVRSFTMPRPPVPRRVKDWRRI